MRLPATTLTLWLLICSTVAHRTATASSPSCANVAATLNDDYSFLIGSADYSDPDGDFESGSTFRWLVNDTPLLEGAVSELLRLPLDGSLSGTGGETPLVAEGVAYDPGRWGLALALPSGGRLSYAREGNLDLTEGTIEMWIALRASGDDPIYTSRNHLLFLYQALNGDYALIGQSATSGIIYAGGMVNGQWQSAYHGAANMFDWPAHQWHHLAYTFSESGNFMRFYLDGVKIADTNEGHYWPPPGTGSRFFIGGDSGGNEAYYLIDEFYISGRVLSDDQIAARARRASPPAANEDWLSTAELEINDVVVFEFTPSDGMETGSPCASDPVTYLGIPITDPNPPSTILAPDTAAFTLSVQTITETECRYAVGAPLDFAAMTPFDTGAETTQHETLISGVDPAPNVLTEIYVRSAVDPVFVLHLKYRCLSHTNPPFPRTGNLWGSWGFMTHGMPYCARIDLWLGAAFNPDQIRELRQLNPDIRVLTSINAIENFGLPDDYYLKDIYGNRVEVWPGSYRLNITKLHVAEHQANYAYQRILDTDLMVDGCFFDNVMTTQSWQTYDIHGNPFLYDYNEDGVVDDPDELDAAWKAGVFHELQTFRQLMPHALVTGHSMSIFEPGIADIFHGRSIGFWTTDVIEGRLLFDQVWQAYEAWHTAALTPHITMVESAPPDQIAYGYDYAPWDRIPPSTLEFARTYYPYVRFGLAFTLMQDGYFAHEFGDTWHGNDWWYDELDFNLGYPTGPAEFVTLGDGDPINTIENGGFENPIAWPWSFWVNTSEGCAATVTRDFTDPVEGAAGARIDVTATSGVSWHIDFAQFDRALAEGTTYDLIFWAKSDIDRNLNLSAQRGSPPWENFGLSHQVALTTEWQEYTVSFMANATTSESRIQFMAGETTGSVWLDDVRLFEQQPYVLRRAFTNGLVLLNPTNDSQQIDVGSAHRRLTGDQAALYEYIIDDADAAFTTTGNWTEVTYESGEWQATGPFYHDWGAACHESGGAPSDAARWDLTIPQEDTYTITAWWPAAPTADTWSGNVLYEILADEQVVAAMTLDQRTGGDEWHLIAEVVLAPGDQAYVRISSVDAAPCIADALHICSAARYNDGSPAPTVTLQPMDGIILSRNPGDLDADGDVDVDDFDQFTTCFTGPDAGPVAPGCEPVDFDADGDVDCADWYLFRQAWTGPPQLVPPFEQCPAEIPTVSTWGMVTMMLLVVTAGTLVFSRLKPLPHGRGSVHSGTLLHTL